MGQHADDLINGDFDYLTGEYIGHGGGYPRTRWNKNHTPWTRKRAVQGVMTYLQHHNKKTKEQADEIIVLYCQVKQIDLPAKKYIGFACIQIQKQFVEFIKWFKKEKL